MSSRNHYPKAIPCHSPEELALQNNRLSQFNEELSAKVKQLNQGNEELAEQAARLSRRSCHMMWFCLALLIVAGIGIAFAAAFPGLVFRPAPVVAASPVVEPPVKETKSGPGAVKANATADVSSAKAALTLPTVALAKPEGSANSPVRTGFLEALGGLSATHLYQTHLNIGLLADGVESETYTVEEADKNLTTVIDLMKLVDGQMARVTKAGIDKEDQESIEQIQAVAMMHRRQADALRAYWASGEKEQAEQYHKARKAAWTGLAKVMGLD